MNGPPVGDLLILLAMSAMPALLVLFLIRRHVGRPWTVFWRTFGLGVFGLGFLSVVAVSLSAWLANSAYAECYAAESEPEIACITSGTFLIVVGLACALTMAIYVLGGLSWQYAKRGRGAKDDKG